MLASEWESFFFFFWLLLFEGMGVAVVVEVVVGVVLVLGVLGVGVREVVGRNVALAVAVVVHRGRAVDRVSASQP